MRQRNLIFVLFIVILTAAAAEAQTRMSQSEGTDASKRSSRDRGDDEPLSTNMLETRARWRQRAEEKEYNEMLERSAGISKISDELNKAFQQNNQITAGNITKLGELEKLIKKVRRNLGGDDDDETPSETRPTTLAEAFAKLAKTGSELNENLEDSTRYEISAASINQLNEMLELIKFIRPAAK